MKKDINYYMKLNYKIELQSIPKKLGGGYEASIPELGRYAFIGYGESTEVALKELEENKKEYFEEFIEKGIPIPEPESNEKDFRGEILIRMPNLLHKELYYAAKENEISLNQYLVFLLSKNFQIYSIGELVYKCFEEFWEKTWKQITPAMPKSVNRKYDELRLSRKEEQNIAA